MPANNDGGKETEARAPSGRMVSALPDENSAMKSKSHHSKIIKTHFTDLPAPPKVIDRPFIIRSSIGSYK